jgi:hypothetical protein
MNWLEITLDDLRDYQVSKLIDALQTKALGTEQTDPASLIIADAVAQIRRKIMAHPGNRLDARLYTIPKGLKALGCRRAIAAMKGRLGMALTDDERKQLDRDEADLNRIADGKDPVDTPDNPAAVPDIAPANTTHAQLARSSVRQFTRENLRCL